MTKMRMKKGIRGLVDTAYTEVKFPLPKGTKLLYMILEMNNTIGAGGEKYYYALRGQSEASIGHPNTPNTYFFGGRNGSVVTSGSFAESLHYERELRGKELTKTGVYFQLENNIGATLKISCELEVELPN